MCGTFWTYLSLINQKQCFKPKVHVNSSLCYNTWLGLCVILFMIFFGFIAKSTQLTKFCTVVEFLYPRKQSFFVGFIGITVWLPICLSGCNLFVSDRFLDLPSSNLVHTSVLGSRGTLLILGSLGQWSRSGSNVPKLFQIV